MEQAKAKRGGPRRGPFSGKKVSFATKLTDETMKRLAAAAGASEMSVSQKAEAALIRGLDAEDDIYAHCSPLLRAFEHQLLVTVPTRSDETDIWEKRVAQLVERLAQEIKLSSRDVSAAIRRREASKSSSEPGAPPPQPVIATPPARPKGRVLQVED